MSNLCGARGAASRSQARFLPVIVASRADSLRNLLCHSKAGPVLREREKTAHCGRQVKRYVCIMPVGIADTRRCLTFMPASLSDPVRYSRRVWQLLFVRCAERRIELIITSIMNIRRGT